MNIPHIRDYYGRNIHIIGIGGSSMSGLASMLKHAGCEVTGSDGLETHTTQRLRNEMHIPVSIGHKRENVHGADLVLYSAAILPDNPERLEAEQLGIPTLERAYVLGQMMEDYPKGIAVCGTHGKTTTTSMLAQILVECGLDPTIHIGGNLDYIGGNIRLGGKQLFLTEACEFKASFMRLHPTCVVILNIEEDHLDYYKDIDDIQRSFGRFLALLPREGMAVGNGDDPRIVQLFGKLGCKTITFGLNPECDYFPASLEYSSTGCPSFDLMYRGDKLGHAVLNVPGTFQVSNALAALAAAHCHGADMEKACAALGDFKGAHRRFELTGVVDGVRLYHDYGHNPTEMKNVLSVAVLQPHKRLWAVMQPHTYSRVKALFSDYLSCTRDADITLVTDIYGAREKDPGDIKAEQLVEGMRAKGNDAWHTPSFDDTERFLRSHWQEGDIVVTMGCGNINQLNDQISAHEKERQQH